jgi:hypothetical protein
MCRGIGAQWKIEQEGMWILENDPWTLQGVVHEARHLAQGPLLALSVQGELEAWKEGFQTYKDLGKRLGKWDQRIDALPDSLDFPTLMRAKWYWLCRNGLSYPGWTLPLFPRKYSLVYLFFQITHAPGRWFQNQEHPDRHANKSQ